MLLGVAVLLAVAVFALPDRGGYDGPCGPRAPSAGGRVYQCPIYTIIPDRGVVARPTAVVR